MNQALNGEWKLLKVWECRKCKMLIKSERDVYDHKCEKQNYQTVDKEKPVYEEVHEIHEEIIKPVHVEEKPVYEEIHEIHEEIIKPVRVDEKPAEIIKPVREEIIKPLYEEIYDEIIAHEKIKSDEFEIKNENGNETICVDIWKQGDPIKDSKDIGYREDIEIEIYERGKEKKRVIIKNGKVHKKPDDVDILGKFSSEGFIMRGIQKRIL